MSPENLKYLESNNSICGVPISVIRLWWVQKGWISGTNELITGLQSNAKHRLCLASARNHLTYRYCA